MADRPDDDTERVSSSQGKQTHEVGESSRPPPSDDDLFKTQVVAAVTMFSQVMQNPKFLAFLQPLLPSQPVGSQEQRPESVKAQVQVNHTANSMETPVHLLETMQSPRPMPNAHDRWRKHQVYKRCQFSPPPFNIQILALMDKEIDYRLCNKFFQHLQYILGILEGDQCFKAWLVIRLETNFIRQEQCLGEDK